MRAHQVARHDRQAPLHQGVQRQAPVAARGQLRAHGAHGGGRGGAELGQGLEGGAGAAGEEVEAAQEGGLHGLENLASYGRGLVRMVGATPIIKRRTHLRLDRLA